MFRTLYASCLIVILLNVSEAQKAFDPYVASIGFDSKPYTSVGQTGTFSFIFGNLGQCNMVASREAMVMTIRMSLDTLLPQSGNAASDLSGAFVPYFSWSYNSSTNTFTGVQTQDLPNVNFSGGDISGGLGVISVAVKYAIATSQSQNGGLGGNGIFVRISIPTYAKGTASLPAPPTCIGTQTGGNGNASFETDFDYNYLPVKLSEFSVKKNRKSNEVNWVTLSESGVSYFLIERSINGFDQWKVIHKEYAAGQSTRKIEYKFIDEEYLPAGKIYYRLRMVDNSEDYDFSKIKGILIENSIHVVTYPNPFNVQINLKIESKYGEKVRISLFDLLGRAISETNFDINSGFNSFVINSDHFVHGTYLLKISGVNINENKIVVKL